MVDRNVIAVPMAAVVWAGTVAAVLFGWRWWARHRQSKRRLHRMLGGLAFALCSAGFGVYLAYVRTGGFDSVASRAGVGIGYLLLVILFVSLTLSTSLIAFLMDKWTTTAAGPAMERASSGDR